MVKKELLLILVYFLEMNRGKRVGRSPQMPPGGLPEPPKKF